MKAKKRPAVEPFAGPREAFETGMGLLVDLGEYFCNARGSSDEAICSRMIGVLLEDVANNIADDRNDINELMDRFTVCFGALNPGGLPHRRPSKHVPVMAPRRSGKAAHQ